MGKTKNTEINLKLDLNIYGMESLSQAAAVWRKKAEVFIEEKSKNKLIATLSIVQPLTKEQQAQYAGEFLNELLNQEYRRTVGSFNKKITEMIVVQALYSASQPGIKDVASELEPAVAEERARETEALMEAARREIDKKQPVRSKQEIPVA